MAEQRRRMTYEEQRALREQRTGGRAASQAGEGAATLSATRGASSRPKARQSVSRQAKTTQTGSRRRETGSRQQATGRQVATRQAAGGSRQQTSHQAAGGSRQQTSHQAAEQHQAAQRPAVPQSARVRATQRSGAATASRPPIFKIGIALVLLVAVVFAVRMCMAAMPINVTVNGTSYELRGSKTMQTAIKTSGLPINPGDFISLKGVVLEKSAGEPFLATVNGEETSDPNHGLRDGDKITLTDGKDIVEEYDVVEEPVPYGTTFAGIGAVHKFEPGEEGVLEIRTGRVSGEELERQTVDPVDITCKQYNLNTGANKVVAFTFDDGPSSEYTASVLDILKENDAKATFFCIGTEVESYPDLVKREYEEGHQVCTHTYDHADPVGGTDVGLMDSAGQIDEVVRGMKTITDVVGGEASRVVRMPGGNLSEGMVKNLLPYIDYEIGWNIDTEDWTLPGEEAIYQAMISVEPGQIVLCHDGGGDRSETVAALTRALPYLKSKGFSFVTMDEILEYPAKA